MFPYLQFWAFPIFSKFLFQEQDTYKQISTAYIQCVLSVSFVCSFFLSNHFLKENKKYLTVSSSYV